MNVVFLRIPYCPVLTLVITSADKMPMWWDEVIGVTEALDIALGYYWPDAVTEGGSSAPTAETWYPRKQNHG